MKNESFYDFKTIEAKWRDYWRKIDLYKTGDDPEAEHLYILDFFPYPSGAGLSVGHCRNYVPTCVTTRFKRMQGMNVLHPMGWDAFGMPAENYAIKHGIHPRETTQRFSDNYRRQMMLAECSYDWSREINSTDPAYYRWTQWFFLLLHERGLAYQALGRQWWCPQCQTILANEQVENGRCWRCASIVTQKELKQWYFKITDYAERLLTDLDDIDWPEPIKQMQRNWIGRSEGATIHFETDRGHALSVFTTRPDTLFGVTFLALAPEHSLLAEIATPAQRDAVQAYASTSQRLSEIERQMNSKEKTGVFTGSYATHPLTGAAIPIWVADYVLLGYGSGAIMGVPGHDSRDLAFAQQHQLPITAVVVPDTAVSPPDSCYKGAGTLIDSGPYSGLPATIGGQKMVADLATMGQGQHQVRYRFRDWLISRQRYWGAPIPIIHCSDCGAVPVPKADLPVTLPELTDFAPAGNGRSPLARANEWVHVPCPACGGPAHRETDTMDGFACSSWYFLRFANPHYQDGPFDPEAVQRWLPVDIYVGGAEHAVMHLLYARFWTKVMYDAGLIDFTEPFRQLRNQGVLHSAADGQRMSKSRGNVVTPDEVVAKHGTDALRTYVLFLGPFDADVIWDDSGIRGITRFLRRYRQWATAVSALPPQIYADDPAFTRQRHQTIKQVSSDMARFRFNTAIAALMRYLNYLIGAQTASIPNHQWRQAVVDFTLLLAPIAPFVTESVWQMVLGQTTSVHQQQWPTYDEAKTIDEHVTVVVQVNGKVRDRIVMKASASEQCLRETAVARPRVQAFVGDKRINKVVVVPRKLVNIVTA